MPLVPLHFGKVLKANLIIELMSDTNTKTNDEWKKRELGALWRVEGRNQSFYSGEIALSDGSKQKIVIFKNKFKEQGTKQPDLRIYQSMDTE